jgi:putative NADH-flavin reductase
MPRHHLPSSIKGGGRAMKVAVFGARGRTGRLVVEELRRAGHEVVAANRRGEAVPGAEAVQADPVTGQGVAAAAGGCDAVVNAMASGKGNPACSGLARALRDREGLRYVSVGGAAVDMPGDRKGVADKVVSWLSRTFAKDVVMDRQVELEILGGSRLRWTMLRPPRLVDGPAKGQVRTSFEKPPTIQITRADLARKAVEALVDDSLAGRAPFVSN